jgi:hypothetical protein
MPLGSGADVYRPKGDAGDGATNAGLAAGGDEHRASAQATVWRNWLYLMHVSDCSGDLQYQ